MPTSVRRLFLVLLALALAGCQGHGRVHETPAPYPGPAEPATEEPQSAPSDPEPRAAAAQESGDYAAAPRSEPPAELDASRRGDSWSEPEARAARPSTGSASKPGAPQRAKRATRDDSRWREREERPGLATHWGETRYSPARQVDFERASAHQPVASYQLHYNDRRGARQMLPDGYFGQSEISALGGGIRLSMVNAAGERFSALRQGDRLIALGDPGERYALLIENRTSERFEVVATVDGLDVLDGEDGDLDKRGYLVGAYSSVLIDGFRRSHDEVAAFRLGDVARSYAASKGKARNVGVIGFALFDERQAEPYYAPYYPPVRYRYPDDSQLRRSAEPFPGSFARPPAW